MHQQAPTLSTDRLTLRGHRLDDFERSLSLWSNAEVTRFIGGRPASPEEVWSRLLRYGGYWPMLGFGYWLIEDRAGGFLGEMGFQDLNRDIDPPFGGAPEIGWALLPGAQGQGYASEAVAAALAWADAELDAPRTVCLISPQNSPSIRVAEKAGYRDYAHTSYRDSPIVLFERS